MATPGPKPKPAETRGREGRSHHRQPETVLVQGRPTAEELARAPDRLDPDAREWWEAHVPALAEAGLIDRGDLTGLEHMAQLAARVTQCQRAIDARGLFSAGSVGQVREAPWVRLQERSILAFEKLAQSYGLTPVGRVRLGLAVLQGRSLAAELDATLSPRSGEGLVPVDADASDADRGLPGA